MNITEIVVKNDYCIGCGVCAGVCPSNNLYMNWSSQGELIPYNYNKCNDKCSICLDVCPFYDHKINQDDIANTLFSKIPKIKYNEYTGYYLDCYVGFQKDEKKRFKSASGGLATSFLSSLLEKNIIDKVVAVGAFDDNDRMFDFKVLNTSEEVYSCSGSIYYPVEISRILKKILNDDENITYAIIALPCFVYSLRLAMEKIPKLKRKVKIVASLTCGQLQNRFCTELLALESGIEIEKISTMDFRRKSKEKYASNFMQVAIDKEGNEGIYQSYHKLPFHLWHYQYFKQNTCNFCDDVFGEVADITFMDAWLPEYIKDYAGTSLTIVRSPIVQKLLNNSHKHILNNIDIQRVIESQIGIVNKKRVLIKGKLYQKEMHGLWYPKKRVKSDANIYNQNKEFFELTYKIQDISKKLWPKHRSDRSTEEFWNNLRDIESEIKEYERQMKWQNLIKAPLKLLKTLFIK